MQFVSSFGSGFVAYWRGMSLVVAHEFEVEAKRVLDAASHFEVLGLAHHQATVEAVREAHAKIKKVLVTRQSIRSVTVQRAKAKLDAAATALGDDVLLRRALVAVQDAHAKRAVDASMLESVRQRTLELEKRAAALRGVSA